MLPTNMVYLPGGYMEWRAVILTIGLVLIYQNHYYKPPRNNEYLIIGVSGGLQHGFPEHNKLDYNPPQPPSSSSSSAFSPSTASPIKAIYLGRALVRGYKAYLDVMEPTHRQYINEPARINSNVFASGCNEHANEYWVYAVDTRQAMGILNNEPRFLSITPDTGLVDLPAKSSGGYTTELVRDFMIGEIRAQNKSDTSVVALPLVTTVWFNPSSHVPSPVIDVLEDGTEITNYPQSLAKWAGVEPLASQLPKVGELEKECGNNDNVAAAAAAAAADETCPSEEATGYHATVGPEKKYWDSIRSKIKAAESNRPADEEAAAAEYGPASWKCKKRARFGVSVDMARVNYAFTADRLKEALNDVGYDVDFDKGELKKMEKKE